LFCIKGVIIYSLPKIRGEGRGRKDRKVENEEFIEINAIVKFYSL